MKLKLSIIAVLAAVGGGHLSADDEALKLSNTIISATGFEQDADSNLRNVIVIDGDDLQDKGYINLTDALSRVPGISFVNFGLGQNIDMRGQGDKANIAVKVMVDGRAINVLDDAHGVTPLDNINLENVERIEIIPGGGAVLYGNGTRGGVINIITKGKPSESGASFSIRENVFDSGNNGTNANLQFSTKFNEKMAMSFNVNGFNKKGYQDGDKDKGFYVNSKFFYDINDFSYVNFGFDYFRDIREDTGYLTKAQVDADPTQDGGDYDKTRITRPELHLNYHIFASDNLEFDTLAYWQKNTIDYLDNGSSTGSGFEDTLKGINLKGKYTYADNSYLVFGYEYARQDMLRRNLVEYTIAGMPPFLVGGGTPYHNIDMATTANKQSHSLYFLDSHQFNEYFSLSGGARYEYASYEGKDSYNEIRQNFPTIIPGGETGSVSFLNDIDKSTNNYALELTPAFSYSDTGRIYAKYERGFISPTPAQFVGRNPELDQNGNLSALLPTNNPYYVKDIDPETYDTFEIGVSDYLWDFYGFNLAVFYTKTKDEITNLGDPHGDGTWWEYVNLDNTTRYGAELSLEQRFLNDKLVLGQSLSYIDAEISSGINDGKLIPYVSKVKATGSASYAWTRNFSTFVNLTYQSRSKDSGDVVDEATGKIEGMSWIKERFITDIGATYQYKALSVFAGVKNLFDEEYYTYQNAYNDNYAVGDGRSYYVEFKYKF